MRRVALALLLGALAWSPLAFGEESLRAGFSVAPLPTPVGGPLGGYGGLRDRTGTAVIDPPEARALVIEQGETRVGVVVLDVVIARAELRRGLLERTRDLDLDLVTLAATHTHSGPGGYIDSWLAERITSGGFDPDLRDGLIASAEAALRAAAAELRDVRPAALQASLELAVNRRDPEGPRETALPILVLEPTDGAAAIVVFGYGAHPTVRSPRSRGYSADYVGAARAVIERAGLRALFVAGPMGDQRPESGLGASWPDGLEAEEHQVREIASRLAEAVLDGVRRANPSPATLRHAELRAKLPQLRFRRFCPLWWLSPLVRSSARSVLAREVTVQALGLGDAELVALPAEPSSSVGDQLRAVAASSGADKGVAERGAERVPFVIAHANEWIGYVVDERAYTAGGYEACLSFHGPGMDSWLVDQTRQALARLDAFSHEVPQTSPTGTHADAAGTP